jgi:hypothetical protein
MWTISSAVLEGYVQQVGHTSTRIELLGLLTANTYNELLPSIWAFKIKRYPNGRIKKFKAQFCAHGDRQTEGVDSFDTWAPVVHWSTVRIVMILAIKLNLISTQCDITADFIHGCVPPTEMIYVHQPRGFNRDNGDEVIRPK